MQTQASPPEKEFNQESFCAHIFISFLVRPLLKLCPPSRSRCLNTFSMWGPENSPQRHTERVHVQSGHPNIGHTWIVTYLTQPAWKCSQRNLQEKSQTSPGLGANKSRDQHNQSRSYRRQGTMYCQVSSPGCTRENCPMGDEVWCSLNIGIIP